MRLLSIIPGVYPTTRPDVAALFGRYLPRRGIHTDIVAQALDDTVPLITDWGGGRAFLSRRTGSRARSQLTAFLHDVQMLMGVRSPAYDAIQVRDKVFAAVLAIWVARIRRLPVFYWLSFLSSEGNVQLARTRGLSLGFARWLFLSVKGHLGRTLLYRYILPRCTHVFVQSDRMLDFVAAEGLPRDRMTPVPMGVDVEQPFPTAADAIHDQRLRGRRVVAYLGSFERFRRLEFLLEVVQHLAVELPDVVLLMIGGGTEPDDREVLERMATSLGIADRIIWTGWLSPTAAWQWLTNADVAVSFIPRGVLYDGASPTKVLEYLALGIPAVVNDQPDQRRVIEESGAGLCCEWDRAAVVRAVVQILNDPQLAERMRTAGPRYIAAERTYDRISDRVAEVYRRRIRA